MTTAPDDIYPEDQEWLRIQIEQLTFGSVLRAYRLCEEWTQEQAAAKLGISKQLLSAYENNRKFPSPKKAYEMGQVLGMVPEALVLAVINDQLRNDHIPLQVSKAG